MSTFRKENLQNLMKMSTFANEKRRIITYMSNLRKNNN